MADLPWTPGSLNVLERLNGQGNTDEQCACHMQRNLDSVRSQRRYLLLPARGADMCRAGSCWSEADLDLLRRLHRQGQADDEIAPVFGRTVRAVANRRHQIGATKVREPPRHGIAAFTNQQILNEVRRRGLDVETHAPARVPRRPVRAVEPEQYGGSFTW